MNDKNTGDPSSVYGRQLLLLGPKRNAVLDLWEVQRYGTDSYGDADYVSIYGMRPVDWYAKGVRLLGRTAVECTRDRLGEAIGKDIAASAVTAPSTGQTLVLDPFAGSGNTLYWIVQQLPGARGVGCQLDPLVFQLTSQNLAALQLSIEMLNTDYVAGLATMPVAADQLLIAFIAPPWGEAFSKTAGIDLRRTTPPIREVVDFLIRRFAQNRLLCAIQVYETTEPVSLAELKERFDWAAVRIYGLNAPGENHGLLLGTHGWVP